MGKAWTEAEMTEGHTLEGTRGVVGDEGGKIRAQEEEAVRAREGLGARLETVVRKKLWQAVEGRQRACFDAKETVSH